jgi:hypothetical protein
MCFDPGGRGLPGSIHTSGRGFLPMSLKFSLAAAFVVASIAPALAQNCSDPIPPATIDGQTATKEQMSQMRDDVVNFIKSSDDYQACLLADLRAQKQQAAKDKKELPASVEEAVNAKVQANQKEKEKVGGEFNAAVVAYKSKHPKG